MAKKKFAPVDLRSDTVTKPSEGMRQAMAEAEVGDDVFGEDPTVNALQEGVARLFEKEAALFVPSGTMANLVAILSQTRPGETLILSEDAHPYNYEGANVALVGGLLTRTIRGELGMITAVEIEPHINVIQDAHFSETTLIAIENTTNRGGGAIYPLETIQDIAALAERNGMSLHCDGARIFHAVVEAGLSPAQYAAPVDTLSFCFSKGLGAPAGSMVVGTRETIYKAHRFRKLLGGGMRQAGILAAAAQYALDHNVERLKEDHGRAAAFRQALEGRPGISFPMPTTTNIVMMDLEDLPEFVTTVGGEGILMIPMGPKRLRAVFHLDVSDDDLERAVDVCKKALS